MAQQPSNVSWDGARELDLTGLKCPLPSLLTEKALRGMGDGLLLAVIVTDALAPLDLRHLCQRGGHSVLAEVQYENGARRLLIRRGPRLLETSSV
ncbi:MAG: sulfurtransferase TusA family protein [Alphaproteobacteria bacterium]|nr:sulfurtransferase TusA family protein [Alphaproteobacteria bacterium]